MNGFRFLGSGAHWALAGALAIPFTIAPAAAQSEERSSPEYAVVSAETYSPAPAAVLPQRAEAASPRYESPREPGMTSSWPVLPEQTLAQPSGGGEPRWRGRERGGDRGNRGGGGFGGETMRRAPDARRENRGDRSGRGEDRGPRFERRGSFGGEQRQNGGGWNAQPFEPRGQGSGGERRGGFEGQRGERDVQRGRGGNGAIGNPPVDQIQRQPTWRGNGDGLGNRQRGWREDGRGWGDDGVRAGRDRDGRGWRGDRRDWDRNGRDWGRDRRDWGRNGRDWRDDRRNWRRDDWRWGWNGRPGWDNRDFRRWDHGWRGNRRFDWFGFRSNNRFLFRPGPYLAPFRGHRYSLIQPGFFLDSLFFQPQFFINDPWAFRLPPAYGPYQWVRYYDDVLLVDIYTGEVVDVIHGFFW